jgi:hypothetical protein
VAAAFWVAQTVNPPALVGAQTQASCPFTGETAKPTWSVSTTPMGSESARQAKAFTDLVNILL